MFIISILKNKINRLVILLRNKELLKLCNCGERTEVRGHVDKRSHYSDIDIGKDCLIDGLLVTEKDGSKIKIGNNVFLGANSILDCVDSIIIEDDVLISYGCTLLDCDGHSYRYSRRKNDLQSWKKGERGFGAAQTKPIKICKGAWIGANSIILKGVIIGEGAIVGAGSVVMKSVPPWTVVAGNPARVIRKIPENER